MGFGFLGLTLGLKIAKHLYIIQSLDPSRSPGILPDVAPWGSAVVSGLNNTLDAPNMPRASQWPQKAAWSSQELHIEIHTPRHMDMEAWTTEAQRGFYTEDDHLWQGTLPGSVKHRAGGRRVIQAPCVSHLPWQQRPLQEARTVYFDQTKNSRGSKEPVARPICIL